MSVELLESLRHLPDVSLHEGCGWAVLSEVQKHHGIVFPGQHRSILRWTNGVEVYGGYTRLFGLHTKESVDGTVWNQPDYWKFAWGDRCLGYWCFGETVWGDQYAYALGQLRAGEEPKVYFMDALSMTAQPMAASFGEFLQKEFVRVARNPYDSMMKQAREKFGPVEVTSHLVYIPSLLLGGAEDIDNVHVVEARSAMVCNGDIATQLDEGPVDRSVKGVQPYEDECHRMRLRLIWS